MSGRTVSYSASDKGSTRRLMTSPVRLSGRTAAPPPEPPSGDLQQEARQFRRKWLGGLGNQGVPADEVALFQLHSEPQLGLVWNDVRGDVPPYPVAHLQAEVGEGLRDVPRRRAPQPEAYIAGADVLDVDRAVVRSVRSDPRQVVGSEARPCDDPEEILRHTGHREVALDAASRVQHRRVHQGPHGLPLPPLSGRTWLSSGRRTSSRLTRDATMRPSTAPPMRSRGRCAAT